MILALDAMGSDLGPSAVIEPVKQFVKDFDTDLWVYGDESALSSLKDVPRVTVIPTTEVMEMEDGPLAVRRKKDSSMVRAVNDLKEGKVDGVVSSGSTGALLSAGSLLVKTVPGVERAGILSPIPSKTGKPFALLDMGANASCTPEQLVNFAYIGKSYMRGNYGIENPRVALLNIGAEPHKGDELRQETYKLLSAAEGINFVGNIEANRIYDGKADIVVADGFSGNICEKAIEGTASFMMKTMKDTLMNSGLLTKIGALMIKKSLKKMKDVLDPNQFGGALIAGLNAPIVKAHGNSNEKAYYNALRQLYRTVKEDVVGKVKSELQ